MSPARHSEAKSPTTTWRQKLLLGAFGLVLGVVVLALAEALLALLGIGDEHRFADPYDRSGRLYLRVRRY